MSLVSDAWSEKKLKENHINIKTKYIVGTEILERNTDGSKCDDITDGIQIEKQYFVDGILKHTEKDFDSRIEYTFLSKQEGNQPFTCRNCGATYLLKDFVDGCPYCKTHYNLDYTDKELGNKYHYDRVLKKKSYRFFTAIFDFLVSFVICFLFITLTSRTFNSYDVIKVFLYALILSCILYYFFYLLDAYLILGPIKKYKDAQNRKQMEFWKETGFDKKTFYNNLNYELRKYYYLQENVIDYDILDYLSFQHVNDGKKSVVFVTAEVRIVTYQQGKITTHTKKECFPMFRLLEFHKLENGTNLILCPNCGSSIDATIGQCEYCQTKIPSLQEWILLKK